MQDGSILGFGGEFRDPTREAAFRAARLPETLRQCRLIFLLSVVLNTLFLISDWRFQGTPHFAVVLAVRIAVTFVSLLCLVLIRKATRFGQAQALGILWDVAAALGLAVMVSSRTDLALFAVLFLPGIIYLAVPTGFAWTLSLGLASSALMLFGYFGPGPYPATWPGLVLVVIVMNAALALVVIHGNRLRRLEWAATQAERDAKEALGESRAMIERLFMAVPIPLVVASVVEGRFLRANDAALRFLGKASEADLADITVADIVTDADSRRRLIQRLNASGHVDEFEAVICDSSSVARDMLVTATSLCMDQCQAIVAGIVDITERKAAQARTRFQATHDGLTGLPNRLLFQERLHEALAGLPYGGQVSLFLIDLDGFKAVNDTLGHDAGDALLVEVAARLSSQVGPDTLVARLGGDEFMVLSTQNRDCDAILASAEALLAALRLPVRVAGAAISARASLGIALAPEHHVQARDLMKAADLALYRAKALGRDRAAIYDPSMRVALTEGRAIAGDPCDPMPSPSPAVAEGFEALAQRLADERRIKPAA